MFIQTTSLQSISRTCSVLIDHRMPDCGLKFDEEAGLKVEEPAVGSKAVVSSSLSSLFTTDGNAGLKAMVSSSLSS